MAPADDNSDVDEPKSKNRGSKNSDEANTRRSTRIRREKRPLSPSDALEPKRKERMRRKQDNEETLPKKRTMVKDRAIKSEPEDEDEPESEEDDDKIEIKTEKEDEEEGEDEGDEFNLKMFNLRRVDDDAPVKKSSVPLNRRGMPARIRKKNKLFFDDSVVTPPLLRPKKSIPKKDAAKSSLTKSSKDNDDKHVNVLSLDETGTNARKRMAKTLRNMLRLHKPQKWIYFEWFYSNIDRVLFFGSNDFLMCLQENFPYLRTKMLSRTEWSVIRRLMGKPRRCSQKFFNEERATLENKRNIIRQIQMRVLRDASVVRDLPDRIPMQLSVGTQVTARLRSPQTGLFTGRIDGCDPRDNTYRITFDRSGIGSHSVPDYEVLADNDVVDMVSLSALHRRYINQQIALAANQAVQQGMQASKLMAQSASLNNTPGNSSYNNSSDVDPNKLIQQLRQRTNFPKHFFDMVVSLYRLLKEKRKAVQRLRSMNDQAERMVAEGKTVFHQRWQHNYAEIVIQLEGLNITLSRYLVGVQRICMRVAPDESRAAVVQPSLVRETSLEEAKRLINEKKSLKKSGPIIDLVTELIALFVQIKTLLETRTHPHELSILSQSLERIRSLVSPANALAFQEKVEVHVQYIMENTLNRGGPLSSLITPITTS